MRTQTRTRCRDCSREWIYSTTREGVCPGCGSVAIERVTFSGLFDSRTHQMFSRDFREDVTSTADTRAAEIVPPPLALVR